MGVLINRFRTISEKLGNNNPVLLRISGIITTIVVVSISGFSGYYIEQLSIKKSIYFQLSGTTLLIIGIASLMASKSLEKGVLEVMDCLKGDENNSKIDIARNKLKHIVGRDVRYLNKDQILRATAETASENAIDGIFAPLFWIFLGAYFWKINPYLPGPLSLGLTYKASSTLDSMLGYRTGNLRWIGTAGARLDDLLTWIPTRLVLISLPLISKPISEIPSKIMKASLEGSKDISPNAGVSQAIFANCLGIRMGGTNQYNGEVISKPYLSKDSPPPTIDKIKLILKMIRKLEAVWMITMGIIFFTTSQ